MDKYFQNKNSSLTRLDPNFQTWRKKTNKNISRGMRDMYRAKAAGDEDDMDEIPHAGEPPEESRADEKEDLAEAVVKKQKPGEKALRRAEGWTPAGMLGKLLGARK